MQSSGKLIIVGIFVVALAGAIAALWFQYDARRRSREFWGSDTALLIHRARKVDLLLLSKSSAEGEETERVTIENIPYEISKQKDISKARGFLHVRDALVRDSAFDWDKKTDECIPQWKLALRFEKDSEQIIVAIDLPCQRVRLVPGGRRHRFLPARKVSKSGSVKNSQTF